MGENIQTEIIKEGTTQIMVPVFERGNYTPSKTPVFYNPKMELSRDISIACIAAFASEQDSYVDALGATGIRGVRVANELCLDTTINDWNFKAYELIVKNIGLNKLDAKAERKNANVLLSESRFDIVDIDPFGSPAPFLDSACRSADKMLCITATDTAPLCGAHKSSGIRKYGASPLKTEYHAEMGIRILLGAIARNLAKYDKSMNSLLAHATDHYYRAYVSLKKGASNANNMIKQMGFIYHCLSCGQRGWNSGLAIHMVRDCPNCRSSTSLAGPLWLGSLHDKKFCKLVLDELKTRDLGAKEQALKIVRLCGDELEIPTCYDQHKFCKALRITPPTIDETILKLQEAGFKASRTHFFGTSFKTDAPLEEIERVLCQ
ncbi:MAG: tRNA (guanine(10)-N(2))-dimethyltransferase [Methanocellales archaeon]|nr:tRNA (guanine(10)-N(2))-dimethyltransferase [Methanocellales archaeon]MDD3421747.1 tRNA (guanine(10)-N(2))-dimethyltransferase [Methanocellales archaeon]MDD4898768.1 tRNA (guanine(10)-N(2))-dimethyltransferase [Methanocellales archaeon]MDD5446524.1 tRNA (guanine(10)-N(2))-dimethyltransferase [Methanocellales archaeon]